MSLRQTAMSLADLAAYVASDTDEYLHENGFVTCEFSIGKGRLEELRPILIANSARIKAAGITSRWIVYECAACRSYHEDATLHVSIENYRFNAEDYVRHLHDEAPQVQIPPPPA